MTTTIGMPNSGREPQSAGALGLRSCLRPSPSMQCCASSLDSIAKDRAGNFQQKLRSEQGAFENSCLGFVATDSGPTHYASPHGAKFSFPGGTRWG